MVHNDRNIKKHLYDPRKGGQTPAEWVPEWDPIFTSDSFFGQSTNQGAILGTVGTSRVLFCYGLVISNISTTTASISIIEGGTTPGTVKIEKTIIGNDEIEIGYGNPRAPICRFNALAPIGMRCQGIGAPATLKVTMSWWDAELR